MNGYLSRVKIHVQTWGHNFEIIGRYRNTLRLRCRAVRIALSNCIARSVGVCSSEKIFKIRFNWVHSRVYFDIIN